MKTQTIKILIGIWKHLSTRRKIQLFIMLCVMVLSGICELISIASVLPFLAAISNPQIILDNKLAINLLSFFELSEPNQILLPFTLIFVVSVLVATSIKLLNLFLYGKLAESIGADFSRDAFRNVLYQNYSEHLLQNSSEIINTITIQLDQTIQVLNFSLQILSALV